MARPEEAHNSKKWILVDARGLVLGRMASLIAMRLRGKHLPSYTPHVDCGDNVVVINAREVFLTGDKRRKKVFFWHTGYPGGIRQRTAGEILDGRFPERVIIKAVERMLPKDSPLARRQLGNLHVYADGQHRQQGQKPEKIDVAAMNAKNSRRQQAGWGQTDAF